MDESTVTRVRALAITIFHAGGIIGALSVGALVNKFGRRKSMLLSNVLALIGGGLMGLSGVSRSYEMLILGHFIIGVFCGLCTGLTPMYVAEIAPTALRGAFGTLHQFGSLLGMLIAKILLFKEVLISKNKSEGDEDDSYLWPLLPCLTVLPSVMQIIMLLFCSESPRYLLINLQQEEKARMALVGLHGNDCIEDDIQEMKEEANRVAMEKKVSILQLFRNPIYRRPIIITIIMNLSQQFSGIQAVAYFSWLIYERACITKSEVFITQEAVYIIFILCSLILVDFAGRRKLHLTGLGGMAICLLVIIISVQLFEGDYMCQQHAVNLPGVLEVTPKSKPLVVTVATVAVFTFLAMFEIGPGPIPWFIATELFAQGARPAAVSVSGCSNWTANLLMLLCLPSLLNSCGSYVLIIFLVLLVLFFLFTYFWVPETKGRTFEDISSEFAGKAATSSNQSSQREDVANVSVSSPKETVAMVEF
ncbi:solute carrier family 2, facilitated glucose transporter member 3-like [Clarias gariepinus]